MSISKLFQVLLLTITLALMSPTSIAQLRQVYKDNNPENYIQNLSFYTPNEGYVAFRDHIAYTQDSGHTFLPKPIKIDNVNYHGHSVNLTFGFAINGVKAFDRNNLLVYGHYGFVPAILRSTNGGINYTLVEQSSHASNEFNKGFTDIVFPENNNVGYAVDADRILKTTNNGASWVTIIVSVGSEFEYLDGVDNNTVYAHSTAYLRNKIIRTTDGGLNWKQLELPVVKDGIMTYAHFITASIGWVSIFGDGNSELFFKTTNGGASWSLLNDPIATAFNSYRIKFINETTGFAIKRYTVYKTTDSGKTWEPLARDNEFTASLGRHRNLQVMNGSLLWAGGEHGFLELSSNAGGKPIPTAYFKADTTGVATSGTVQLLNYSKPDYTYQWIINRIPVSNSYNATYNHDPDKETDTIQLIVSDGAWSDTAFVYLTINPPVIIYDFNPKIGIDKTVVTITGNNFDNAHSVKFGNIDAYDFKVLSKTEIQAVVSYGTSGAVTVTTDKGVGVKPGFTFYNDPRTDLPLTISDTILCKSEAIRITLKNAEPLVRYSLTDNDMNIYGSVESSGGTVEFITRPISRSGYYNLLASRMDIVNEVTFPKPVIIEVEHTISDFGSEFVNLIPGQITSFHHRSYQASSFQWMFQGDASITSSNEAFPTGISYASTGQKTLTLISKSINGCADTITGNAVFVYPIPSQPTQCYGLTVTDSLIGYQPQEFIHMNKVLVAANGDFYLSGSGNKPELKSRFGVNKKFSADGLNYFAKYTSDGVLMWTIDLPAHGTIYGADKDDQGNVYILGYCYKLNYLHFPKGDSIQVGSPSSYHSGDQDRMNGFILKIDPQGNYIWHAVLENPTPTLPTNSVMGGIPTNIKIKSDKIVLSGICMTRLNYYHNQNRTVMLDISSSTYGSDNNNGFVLAIDTSGSYLWSLSTENRATNNLRNISSLGIDQNGNVLIGGYYENGVSITDAGKQNIRLTGAVGAISSYLLKVSDKGSLLWKIELRNNDDFRRIQLNDFAIDATGNSYITGSSSTLGLTGSYTLIDASEDTILVKHGGLYLAKINADGELIWETGTTASFYGGGTSIVLHDTSIYLTGYLSGNDFDPTPMEINSTDGYAVRQFFNPSVFFILQYGTDGKIKRINSSGSDGYSRVRPNKLDFDLKNNLLITASNAGSQNFSSYFNVNQTSSGRDGILLKLSPNLCLTSAALPPVDAGNDEVLCAGDSTTIGGTPNSQSHYYWTSLPAGFTSDQANPVVKPDSTTKFLLTVTLPDGIIVKDSVTVTINKPVTNAGIDTLVCANTQITLGTEALAGYVYNWKSSPTGFISTEPQPRINADKSTAYILTVIGTEGCQYIDTVLVNVRPILEPTVTIATDTTSICAGTSASFIATVVNAGDDPSYRWTINGTIQGSNSNIFESTNLRNGDLVALVLEIKETCANKEVANSNEIRMHVSPLPQISIYGTVEVVKGQSSSLKVTLNNPEVIIDGYQWQDSTAVHSWQSISGAADTILTYKPSTTGDKIRCLLTSNLNCAGGSPLISNSLTFTVKVPVGIDPVPVLRTTMRYYPNPVMSALTVDSIPSVEQWETIELFNLSGRRIRNPISIARKQTVTIDLTDELPGTYLAILRRKTGSPVYFKFIKL